MMNTGTEKRLRVKLCITLIIYTVAGYLLAILFDYIFSRFSNTFFLRVHLRIEFIYFLYLVIGFFYIFYYYWKKPWAYLQEVMNAIKIVYQSNDKTIELSEPLKDMEKQMNQIKMAVMLSQQAVREAESKRMN